MSDTKLSIYGDWLVQEADGCTCQGSDAHYGHQPGCGYEPLLKLAEIKAALKAARMAVVELPEPVATHVGDGDGIEWETGVPDGLVTAYIDPPEVFVDSDSLHVDQARALAAALLAAAEAVQP